jgi:hypothetical protein
VKHAFLEVEMKKNESNGGKEFRSPDLYYSAYLQTAGVMMIRTDRENGRVYFVFDVSIANVEELKNAWFNGTGKVAALPFSNNIKALKSICHM